MSGVNKSFLNLIGFTNPNAGSPSLNLKAFPSGFPNPLGMSSQELYLQHQRMLYWEQSQQNTQNTNFQNLQFTQQSQNSQTETNEVPETPTSPPKPKSCGKRK